MKKIISLVLLFTLSDTLQVSDTFAQTITLTKEALKDKIKGGWAGQTIGVTFGGPYEFRFQGTFIQDYQPLMWYDGLLKDNMLNNAGLYDDLYMDLTFVDVFEHYGLDAPVDSFANAFARAGYMLWHANQAARYNILNGIKAPMSGYWMNNPHADDIDYQIESDFAGLMSPGMPNTASAISDKVGHIMNYGDGWYGGVFIGAMYTQAFVSKNINSIVTEALKTIPQQSDFYKCITDVIKWHKQYPSDWHQTWFELQKKWSNDIACGEGVFNSFDIDSKLNSAYVVLGLLYGNGDYSKSLDITARAGQDADCNPSSVGGILGTMLGYKKIPAYWKMGLKDIENMDFKYTTMSLNKTYDISFRQALENITRNGGRVSEDSVRIKIQIPQTVKFEQGFPKLYPVEKKNFYNSNVREASFEFKGTGFILRGESRKLRDSTADHDFEAELYIDNDKVETAKLPTAFTTRRYELFWKYALPNTKHSVRIKVLNPTGDAEINTWEYIVYSDEPLIKK
jgi:hypothetical protein